ncbi:MAG: carboxypeptidase-like regulatory domain-containing protein [Muribaculaceae bacterium]|nr:carboxypeptidase-like regulatory domain-containing protein [Muribaculaceae bacterium]
MNGKHICERLKDIRLSIAQANDIDYTPAQCEHKGDCSGTCPACEKEMRYIERQLLRRQAIGKVAMVAGLALGATSISPALAQTQVQPSTAIHQSVEPKLEDYAPGNNAAIVVRGRVIDETDREQLIGATISIFDEKNKRTRYATVTNFDGRFAIRVPKGYKVQIDYVGYETEKLTLNEANDNLLIVMKDSEDVLGEVMYLPPKMPDVDADIYEKRY